MSSFSEIFHVVFILLSRLFLPQYNARLQLLTFQVKMLRARIDDSKIIPTEAERAELVRLGTLIDHGIPDVMLVVKPATYRRWLKRKDSRRRRPGWDAVKQRIVELAPVAETHRLDHSDG